MPVTRSQARRSVIQVPCTIADRKERTVIAIAVTGDEFGEDISLSGKSARSISQVHCHELLS